MTNEQAVEKLKILKEDYWDDDGYGHESKLYDDTELALDMAIKALEKRKTGKWMQVEWGKTLFGKKIVTYRCSRCANYLDFKGLNCGRGSAWYCPNCGAEMEGAEE